MLSNHHLGADYITLLHQYQQSVAGLTQRPTAFEFKKKRNTQTLMWHKINSRGHHGRSCHYWSGNSSSCTSALVSGNKLMWCRQKPFLPLVGVCWVCNVLAQSSQKQQDGFIMCYHLQQLGCFISWDSALFHFHRPSPVFWWIFDDEGAGPHLDLDKRRLFF